MYRVSPFTYLVSAVLSTGVSGTSVNCSEIELLKIPPPSGETCGSYLGAYAKRAGGRVLNRDSTSECRYCAMDSTDQFLEQVNIYFSERWRNVGILFVYIVFNLFAAIFLYWLIRVPKRWSRKVKKD